MCKPKLEKYIRYPLECGLQIFGGKWKSRRNLEYLRWEEGSVL